MAELQPQLLVVALVFAAGTEEVTWQMGAICAVIVISLPLPYLSKGREK